MSELAHIEYVKMWMAKFGPTQYEDNIFKFVELAIAQHAEIERLKKAYTLTVASWQIRAEKAEAEIEKLRAANKDSKAWFAEVLARAEKAEAEVERLKDEWYSPSHMDAVQERTIDPLRKEVDRLKAEREELVKMLEAVSWEVSEKISDQIDALINRINP